MPILGLGVENEVEVEAVESSLVSVRFTPGERVRVLNAKRSEDLEPLVDQLEMLLEATRRMENGTEQARTLKESLRESLQKSLRRAESSAAQTDD